MLDEWEGDTVQFADYSFGRTKLLFELNDVGLK